MLATCFQKRGNFCHRRGKKAIFVGVRGKIIEREGKIRSLEQGYQASKRKTKIIDQSFIVSILLKLSIFKVTRMIAF